MIHGEVVGCDVCRKKVVRKLLPLSDTFEWTDLFSGKEIPPFKDVKMAVVRGGKNLTPDFSKPVGLTLCDECYDKIFSRYPIGYDEGINAFYLRLSEEE